MTTGADPLRVPEETILAREANVLLLWLVARERGCVPNCSALHADDLYIVADVGRAAEWLRDRGFLSDLPGVFEVTQKGRDALRLGRVQSVNASR